jgi:hypothetical protein
VPKGQATILYGAASFQKTSIFGLTPRKPLFSASFKRCAEPRRDTTSSHSCCYARECSTTSWFSFCDRTWIDERIAPLRRADRHFWRPVIENYGESSWKVNLKQKIHPCERDTSACGQRDAIAWQVGKARSESEKAKHSDPDRSLPGTNRTNNETWSLKSNPGSVPGIPRCSTH